MQRLRWLLLVCCGYGFFQRYHLNKYEPQIEGLAQRVCQLEEERKKAKDSIDQITLDIGLLKKSQADQKIACESRIAGLETFLTEAMCKLQLGDSADPKSSAPLEESSNTALIKPERMPTPTQSPPPPLIPIEQIIAFEQEKSRLFNLCNTYASEQRLHFSKGARKRESAPVFDLHTAETAATLENSDTYDKILGSLRRIQEMADQFLKNKPSLSVAVQRVIVSSSAYGSGSPISDGDVVRSALNELSAQLRSQ